MKASKKFLYVSIISTISIIMFVIIENYYLAYNIMVLSAILFIISIFMKIFEYLEELEQRTRPSYEELEKIFREHFIKRKHKKSTKSK